MRTSNFDALVIKSINYSDSDKIFTLFVKDLGKISAKAKGIRKINSKRLSTLDTLNLVRVGLYGQGDFRTITEANLIFSFSNIKSDLARLKTSFYFLELINRLILETEDNKIYDILLKCLKRLDEKSFSDTRVENYFELNLLDYLGYPLTFTKCVRCEYSEMATRLYSFNYEEGGLVCENCQYSENYLNITDLNSIFYLMSLGTVSTNFDFSVIDSILKYYINTLLSDTPKTLKFLKSI